MPPRRLSAHPLTTLEQGGPVDFFRNGWKTEGRAGEPYAVSLYAQGQKVLSRSMRYHRPRGLFCGTGDCTSCLATVNGIPNTRTCQETCAPLAWLEDQNAFPDAEHDVLALADLAFPKYLDAHRAFIRPKALKPLYTRIIRGMAGFGRVPSAPIEQRYDHRVLETDVCVVGAGPAGLAAAEAASSTGLHVLLLDREPRIGGRLRHLPTPFLATGPDAPRTEGKAWASLVRTKLEHQGVTIVPGARLIGIYPELRIAAATATRMMEIRARSLVLAPGASDDYRPFPGSDRAGVLQATAALRMLNEHGVLPGDDVAIIGATRPGLLLARDLLACGARVAALVDLRTRPPRDEGLENDVRRLGVAVRWGATPRRVVGRGSPRGLELDAERDSRIPCDAVVLATGRHPNVQLFQQAGCQLDHNADLGGFRPVTGPDLETTVPHVYAAGSALGVLDEWASHLSGRLAGLSALHSLSLLADEAPLQQARAAYEAHLIRRGFTPRAVLA